jgi:hypothetical protein
MDGSDLLLYGFEATHCYVVGVVAAVNYLLGIGKMNRLNDSSHWNRFTKTINSYNSFSDYRLIH